ncbi:uncharacterized protein LOC133119280 [Conger conger]|uniref:uncharacterized protein LOC133119280 n=1 Tax=Conger conger TaxID=82655 RepID=UPI002A5AA88C|nr:uncharacterized protein LOC133119280 [Conger conger]
MAHLPSSGTAEALKTFRTEEVFPCENGTEYLHQKESFIIALDPNVPANFRVTAWDSSILTVGWDYPPSDRLASFLVTVFHTNGSGHVLEERRYRQEPDRRGFMAGPLSPCSRVRLGLQAECRGPGPARPSTMALSDGNSANSEIINLRQSTSRPHSYTVRWSVRNFSSVSSFRVYHQGELRGSAAGWRLLEREYMVGFSPLTPTDPDECGSHSLCINTLDSFTCVCQPGYYDLSPFLTAACHDDCQESFPIIFIQVICH